MNDRDKNDTVDNFMDFILSDDAPLRPEDRPSVDLFNGATINAEEHLARGRLQRAKAGLAAAARDAEVKHFDIERARRLFERAKAGDTTARVTLAARFGDGSMEGDMNAILEDLAELEEDDRDED